MRNYYFLANALPELQIDSKPVVSFEAVMTLFAENLSAFDWAQVKVLRLYYDLLNILRFWEDEPLDVRGNLSQHELKDALEHREYFPDYVFEFLEEFSDRQDQIENFSSLLSTYFENEGGKDQVSADIVQFERELRLHLMGYRAQRLNKDLVEELKFENQNDPLVETILSQKDHSQFDFGSKFSSLSEPLQQAIGKPLKEEGVINKFKFNFYSDYQVGHPFSLHFVLAFTMQLMILEDVEGHDAKRGEDILNSIVKESA